MKNDYKGFISKPERNSATLEEVLGVQEVSARLLSRVEEDSGNLDKNFSLTKGGTLTNYINLACAAAKNLILTSPAGSVYG